MKRTWQPKKAKRVKKLVFLKRMDSHDGRNVLNEKLLESLGFDYVRVGKRKEMTHLIKELK